MVVFGESFSVVAVEGILVAGEVVAPYDVWSFFSIVVVIEAFKNQ